MQSNVQFWNCDSPLYPTKVPQDLILDTNVAVSLSFTGDPKYRAALSFVKQCQANNKILYFTSINQNELIHQLGLAVAKAEGLTRYGIKYNDVEDYKAPNGYKQFYRDLEDHGLDFEKVVTPRVEAKVDIFMGLVEFLPVVQDTELMGKARELRRILPYEIEQNDIMIMVAANQYGINTFVTSDNGFFRTNNCNIISLNSPPKNWKTTAETIIPCTDGCIYLK